VGVANIDYDAKGQRQRIDYKNGASTLYSYDTQTFRLTQLLTNRNAATFPGDDPHPHVAGWPGRQVQNLHYTYDLTATSPISRTMHSRPSTSGTSVLSRATTTPMTLSTG
jgi:hypothetical protein